MKKTKTIKRERGSNNPLLNMISGRYYTLMGLVEKLGVSRQYINYMLNLGYKNKLVDRTGLRKNYKYVKIKSPKEIQEVLYRLKYSNKKAK